MTSLKSRLSKLVNLLYLPSLECQVRTQRLYENNQTDVLLYIIFKIFNVYLYTAKCLYRRFKLGMSIYTEIIKTYSDVFGL